MTKFDETAFGDMTSGHIQIFSELPNPGYHDEETLEIGRGKEPRTCCWRVQYEGLFRLAQPLPTHTPVLPIVHPLAPAAAVTHAHTSAL